MRSLAKYASSAVVLVALAASGCLKSDETITIYPDGSGKIEMKTTLLGMMAQMARAGGMPPMGGPEGEDGMGGGMGGGDMAGKDPFELLKKGTGSKVYWANLKSEDGAGGEYTLSGTGYFEDVNQLNGKERQVSFKRQEAGEGFVFEMKGAVPDQLTGQLGKGDMGGDKGKKPTPEQEQMIAMMRGMMAGFDMKVKVVMPGAVTSAEGMIAGESPRVSVFALGEKDLQAIMDRKQEPPKEMKIVSKAGDAAALEAEMAAFKKDLAAAKAASEKEAAEKAAEKKAERDAKKAEGGEKKGGDKGGKPQDF